MSNNAENQIKDLKVKIYDLQENNEGLFKALEQLSGLSVLFLDEEVRNEVKNFDDLVQALLNKLQDEAAKAEEESDLEAETTEAEEVAEEVS